MRVEQLRAVPVSGGDGIVAHLSAAVLLILPRAEQRERADELLDAAREVCAAAPDAPAMALARRLAQFITAHDADEVPTIGSVADADAGIGCFLYGDVELRVEGTDPLQLSGHDAATWVDRIVTGEVTTMTLTPAGISASPPDRVFELRDGVVPGQAVILTPEESKPTDSPPPAPADADVDAPDASDTAEQVVVGSEPDAEDASESTEPTPAMVPPEPPDADEPAPAPSFASISLVDVDVEPREPLPVEDRDVSEPEEEAEAPGAVPVEGILCSRRHLNSPDALYCSSCGISMVHRTHDLVEGPRPPLGFLVLDDGSMFTLDSDYVIGREPAVEGDDLARPLTLDDPDRTVSRVHAEIRLEGWDVRFVDRGSANGTFVWDGDRTQWRRLEAGASEKIVPGSRVALGQRTLVYETPHRR